MKRSVAHGYMAPWHLVSAGASTNDHLMVVFDGKSLVPTLNTGADNILLEVASIAQSGFVILK